jgi:DNA-binding response OmpR family regulator
MPPSDKTVMIVDDDASFRIVVAKAIAAHGYKTLAIASGGEAVTALKSGVRVDLLVLDVLMPGLDGFETLAEIRRLGHDKLPVVFLTAKSRDEDVISGYEKGADYYITKPLKPAALLNIVDVLIGDLPPEQRARLEAKL